jgi:chromosome partitioning protein
VRARTFAITNQKGGVGKSTTALNLGAAFAEQGERTLLADLDPHAGLTFSLGFDDPEKRFERTAYELLDPDGDASLRAVAVPTEIPNLDLVPSHLDLVEIDYKLVGRAGWANILKHRIRDAGGAYQHIILDTPPSLGFLTRMAIVAADVAIVPVQAEWLALRGLQLLQRVLQQTTRETGHEDLEVRYLLTMHQRTRHSAEVETLIRDTFKGQVYETVIRRSVAFADSTVAGKPVLLFDSTHPGAQAYRQLAKETQAHAQAHVGG